MRLIVRRSSVAHVLVGVLALSIGASVTVAAGVAGGVITACENVATGILRIETTSAPCIVSASPILARAPLLLEERLTWNQVGPQGTTGPRGATGANGDSGAQGPAGPTGVAGSTGPTGAAGAPGEAGPKGDPGAGIIWRGQYSSASSYSKSDAVEYQGSSYVANAALTPAPCSGICVDQNAPGLNTAWNLVASHGEAGAQGATGPQGPTGAGGPAGPAGSAGAPATQLWAAVRSNGTLVTGTAANSAKWNATFHGYYLVAFNQDVSTCAWLATQRLSDGEVFVTQDSYFSNDPKVLLVETYFGRDAFTNSPLHGDAGFSIAVFC